jgi:hypothetical protein
MHALPVGENDIMMLLLLYQFCHVTLLPMPKTSWFRSQRPHRTEEDLLVRLKWRFELTSQSHEAKQSHTREFDTIFLSPPSSSRRGRKRAKHTDKTPQNDYCQSHSLFHFTPDHGGGCSDILFDPLLVMHFHNVVLHARFIDAPCKAL